MRKLIITLATILLLSASLSAQTIVTSAYKLAWDNTNEAGAVSASRIYLSRTEGIVPDGTNYATEIADGVYEWPIEGARGRWYAVATFTYIDMDGTLRETVPSNEVTFIVVGPPENLRIVSPIGN